MLERLGNLLGRGDAAALSGPDLDLVRRVEALMPEGRLSATLAADDGRPTERAWTPALSSAGGGEASLAARRAAEVVLDELRQYFEAHRDVRCPNARSVLGGRLGRWAEQVLDRGTAVDEVRWWCELLLRVEDARLFTRSNWVSASSFEDALSHCRRVLVDLRGEMEQDAAGAGLGKLREAMQLAHSAGRDAADRMLELLFLALRARPSSDRRCFHDLERRRQSADDTVEDRLIFSILELERRGLTDFVAGDLLAGLDAEGCSAEEEQQGASNALFDDEDNSRDSYEEEQLGVESDSGSEHFEDGLVLTLVRRRQRPTDREAQQHCPDALAGKEREAVDATRTALALLRRALQRGDGAPTTRIPPELVSDVGLQAVEAFFELHGLYCILSSLLQRMDLAAQAVQEYGSFVCFLPVHRAAVLDLGTLFKELRSRIACAACRLTDAYERLPRTSAPPGRGEVLEKCRGFLQRLDRCSDAVTLSALPALQACVPTSTLSAFRGWQSGDLRWLQVSRVGLAARTLLPSRELASLDVPDLAASLMRCHIPLALEAPQERGGRRHSSQSGDHGFEPAAPERQRHDGCRSSALEPHCRATRCEVVPAADSIAAWPPARRLARIGLARLADEDTRLHALGCSLGVIGQRAMAAAGPACGMLLSQVPHVSRERLDEWLREKMAAASELPVKEKVNEAVSRASKMVAAYLDPMANAYATDVCDDHWVLVEPQAAALHDATPEAGGDGIDQAQDVGEVDGDRTDAGEDLYTAHLD